MSLKKWLESGYSKSKGKKIEESVKPITKAQKKKAIKKITQTKEEKKKRNKDSIDEFLSHILEFKEFLNSRTYLRGDFDRIITWIRNINYKYEELLNQRKSSEIEVKKTKTELVKEIPPKFLDEKLSITLKKFVYKSDMNKSDKYYLGKLKKIVQNELKKGNIYQVLDKILND